MATVEVEAEGKGRLKFGMAYGFQNIQSIMLKMKRGVCDLDFVEVMACPSGCINGGGQLREEGEEKRSTEAKLRLKEFDRLMHSHKISRPEDSRLVRFLQDEGLLRKTDEDEEETIDGIVSTMKTLSSSLLYTTYHAVPKLDIIAPTVIKW